MDNTIHNPTHYPLLVLALSFITMWLSVRSGRSFLRRRYKLSEEMREDFNVIQAATLTLLALIIGFSFSMAISRYDQRKNLEEEEANAIGTEYVRADLLSAADGAKAVSYTHLDVYKRQVLGCKKLKEMHHENYCGRCSDTRCAVDCVSGETFRR